MDLQHKQRQRHILDSEKNIVSANAKKEHIESTVSDLNEKQKEIQDRKKEKVGQIKEKGKEHDAVTKVLDENTENFNKMEKEDHGLREDMKNTNAKRKKIKADAEMEKTKKEKLENLPEENKKKIGECEEHRDSWEKKVEEKEKEYDAAVATLRSDSCF